jgi:general secretion pathway protein A
MYESFFGLRELPFELSTGSRYFLLTPGHTEAFLHLRVGIASRGGITLLVGLPGTGKTTLLRQATREAAGHVQTGLLITPPATRAELITQAAEALDLGVIATRAELHGALLRRLERQPGGLALLLDEAQALPEDALEECRLLGNVETADGRRLSIVLAGHPDLTQRINHPHLAPLKQRIGARCTLAPLALKETAAYVNLRVTVAGGEAARIFAAGAVRAIHSASSGIPRTINVLCHNALLATFGAGRPRVEFDDVVDVCGALDLPVPVKPAPVTNFTVLGDQPAERSRFTLSVRLPRRGAAQPLR